MSRTDGFSPSEKCREVVRLVWFSALSGFLSGGFVHMRSCMSDNSDKLPVNSTIAISSPVAPNQFCLDGAGKGGGRVLLKMNMIPLWGLFT